MLCTGTRSDKTVKSTQPNNLADSVSSALKWALGINARVLALGADGGEWSASHSGLLVSKRKADGAQLIGWVGLIRSGRCGEWEMSCPCRESNSWLLSSPARSPVAIAPPSHPSGRKYSVFFCLCCAGRVNQITTAVIGGSVLEFPLQQRGSFVSTDENVEDSTELGHYFIWLMSCVTSYRYSTVRVGERRGDCGFCDKRSGGTSHTTLVR